MRTATLEQTKTIPPEERPPVTHVSVREAASLVSRRSARLIDVRSPAEFDTVHAQGAESIPLDVLNPVDFGLGPETGVGVLILCQSGGRAARAAKRLAAAGVRGCAIVDGGTEAWVAAGLPSERGASDALPLMRQVQLTVGVLGAAGSILGMTVDSHFGWIPLIIGLGMTLAGATGFCGLAVLLARMPWNQKSAAPNRSEASCCSVKQ